MTTDSSIDAIPGWFFSTDRKLFRWFLSEQIEARMAGDLAELGVYLGKSAVLIGDYLQPGETFTVIDLFESPAGDSHNQGENDNEYAGLTQQAFEANYLRCHPSLPNVVRGFSEEITDHAAIGRHRFVHIDASHLYEHVRGDIAAARQLILEGGIVVFDDIRSEHTPGVAAAVWQAVTAEGLHPLIISEMKLYATWADPTDWRQRLLSWLPTSGLPWEEQPVAGEPIIRCAAARSSLLPRVASAVLPPLLLTQIRRWRSQMKEKR